MKSQNYVSFLKFQLVAVAAIFLFSLVAEASAQAAGLVRLDFKVSRKREDSTEKQVGAFIKKEEKWTFNVEVTNSSGKDQKDLEFKYRIFIRSDDGRKSRTKQETRFEEGSHTIAQIDRSKKDTFNTKVVSIKGNELAPNFYYPDGKDEKVMESVLGIWIQVYREGSVVANNIYPTSLAGKVSWE